MLRTTCLILACMCLCSGLAWADPDKLISQYAHTAWRVQDGFFRGNPQTFAQTQDGYLWIGTDSDVVRFDGVRFLSWNADRDGALINTEVNQLLAARDAKR